MNADKYLPRNGEAIPECSLYICFQRTLYDESKLKNIF